MSLPCLNGFFRDIRMTGSKCLVGTYKIMHFVLVFGYFLSFPLFCTYWSSCCFSPVSCCFQFRTWLPALFICKLLLILSSHSSLSPVSLIRGAFSEVRHHLCFFLLYFSFYCIIYSFTAHITSVIICLSPT